MYELELLNPGDIEPLYEEDPDYEDLLLEVEENPGGSEDEDEGITWPVQLSPLMLLALGFGGWVLWYWRQHKRLPWSKPKAITVKSTRGPSNPSGGMLDPKIGSYQVVSPSRDPREETVGFIRA